MTELTVLALGVALGLRHATDADHVVAVSAMVGGDRSLGRTLRLGLYWGIGHSLSVLLVGGAIVLFGLAVPQSVELSLELGVALMLVALGIFNLAGNVPRFGQEPQVSALARPLAVGLVHGLAGSAAVALLVLTTIREPFWALSYLALFGVGTMVGMALLTAALAVPLAVVARRFSSADVYLSRLMGVLSIAVGIGLGYRVGVVDGLFRL